MKNKLDVKGAVSLDSYAVFCRAVEEGINWGFLRAHKYSNKPSEEFLKQHIQREVENSVTEYFKFGDE